MTKTILIPISKGSEELETITLVNILRRAEINVILYSNNDIVYCARGTKLIPDINSLSNINIEDISGIILPGGIDGVNNLIENDELIEFLKEAVSNRKLVGAICAAPKILDYYNLLPENMKLTSHPSIKNILSKYNYSEEKVVIYENFITSRGVGTGLDFAFKIVEILLDESVANKIKTEIVYS
jgi:DJ-1 family protein